jgi:acyl-CoA thioesterase
MDSRTFLGLQRSHNPYRWHMEVTQGLSTPGDFLFGGCGLGAATSALEGTTGRPVVWATAQYLSFATIGEVMDVDVTIAVSGHQMSQGRVVAHVGDREILTVNAALGNRPFDTAGQWEQMPLDVAPPEACAPRPSGMPIAGTVNERIEVRIARGRTWDELDGQQGDGQVLAWARIPEVIEAVDATALAILGDYVPMGVGQALGIAGGGTSLDNTLRVVHLVPTKWVLLDIRVHAVHHGFGHGLVHMFAEDGTLLATASQSCVVRLWQSDPIEGERPR